ncbi:unnamed protein product [Haemonchus placei]|uniref:AGC-kinase C-terminal domain-containing protein n=1 Tax=Haemonchus placei TaxID=6290 RepID=A0A0N4W8K5_HAEPC|nr:unnamed protein product [Haemonchus placei]
MEAIGIMDDPDQQDDDVCLQFFNNTITYNEKDKHLNKFFEAEEDEKVPQIQKLLGLQWNTSEDKLSLTLPQKPPKEDHKFGRQLWI